MSKVAHVLAGRGGKTRSMGSIPGSSPLNEAVHVWRESTSRFTCTSLSSSSSVTSSSGGAPPFASIIPVKRHRGEPGHSRDTHGRTRTHGPHRRTSQPSKPTNAQPARQRDDRSRGRLNSRSAASPEPTAPRGRSYREFHPGVFEQGKGCKFRDCFARLRAKPRACAFCLVSLLRSARARARRARARVEGNLAPRAQKPRAL